MRIQATHESAALHLINQEVQEVQFAELEADYRVALSGSEAVLESRPP